MPVTVRQSMTAKGWNEKEIAHAENILYSDDKQAKHYSYVKSVHPMLYWMGLLIAIIGNMMISIFLIPFLLVMTSFQLYVIIGVMGVVFGAMFNFLLRDIEHVDYKHHVLAGIFIPALATITILVLVNVANTLAAIMNLGGIHQSAGIITMVYVLSFSTPYLIYKFGDLNAGKKYKETVAAKADEPPKQEEAPKHETNFASDEEAWKVYQHRQTIDDNRIQSQMVNKYNKYL